MSPPSRRETPSPEIRAPSRIPPDAAESKRWCFFLLERDQILRLKWLQSENVGHAIGLSNAIQI